MRHFSKRSVAAACAWTLALLVPASAFGTGLVRNGTDLISLNTLDVTAAIDDEQATITSVRTYDTTLDSDNSYVFYRTIVGGNAASEPQVVVNGQAVSGALYTGAEADAKRHALVLILRDPAPLKHQGQPLFISEKLPAGDGGFGLTIEETTTIPLRAQGTMRAAVTPIDWYRGAAGTLQVEADVEVDGRLRALYSPYQPLTLSRDGLGAATGVFKGYNHTTAFDITILTSSGDAPYHLDVLPFRYDDVEGGHFLALLSPDASPSEDQVVPRDISIVLDQSGSMQGEKIGQARIALKDVLDGLLAQDSFALTTFHSKVSELNDEAVPATAGNLSDAKAFVDEIVADGGTNLHDALQSGIQALPLNKGNPRYVVLLTDGIPTEGETDTEAILDMVRSVNEVGARIVIFGIGDDVNTVLLEKLAKESGGKVFFIRFGNSVEDAVKAFFETMQAPVMANPTLDLTAFGASDLYPKIMPDFFAGQTVAVLGRYDAPGAAQLTLSGMVAGEQVEHTFDVTLPSYAVDAGYAPKIWATRHIGTLLHTIKLDGKDPALVAEALETARRYGIVTEFTFYTVDEAGDSSMTYSEVPMDSVGDKAVAASAAMDEMEHTEEVRTYAIADARWFRDRVLPLRGAYFTDTYPKETPEWIDIHFGSEAYFALAADELQYGVGGFLGVGRNVRFELLGRTFRISDPTEPPEEVLPAEAAAIPAPAELPMDVFVTVAYAGGTSTPVDTTVDVPLSGGEAGCTSSGAPAPGALALFLLGVAGLAVRRRTRVVSNTCRSGATS